MSNSFTVRYPGKRCPHCKGDIEPGEEAQFESIEWPYGNPIGTNPKDMRMWHTACVWKALRSGLCDACGLLHKDKGMCLI